MSIARYFSLAVACVAGTAGLCLSLAAQAQDILFTSNRGAGVFQLYRMAPDGSGVQLLTREAMPATHIDGSADGRTAVFVSLQKGQSDVYSVELATGRTTQLTADAAMDATPIWSPDGRQIVFQSYRDNTPKLYIMNADGSGQRKLTDGVGEESAPAFSPDGQQVAYVVSKGRREAQIQVVNVLSGKSTPLGAQPATGLENMIRWSPDGSRIVYVIFKDDVSNIHSMRADGSDKLALTQLKSNNNDPQWSADGKQILFLSMRNGLGRQAIFVMNADGSGQRELIGGAEEHLMARWSGDGKQLYFVKFHGGGGQIYVADADGSNVRKLSKGSGYDTELLPSKSIQAVVTAGR